MTLKHNAPRTVNTSGLIGGAFQRTTLPPDRGGMLEYLYGDEQGRKMAAQARIITQIGSLPYRQTGAAVAYSLKHDIPFLPELPALGDSMLEYIKNPGKLSCLAEFKAHRFEMVKIQSVGPATLMLSGYGEDDAIRRVYEHIAAVIDGLDAKEVILFLDEPALGHCGFDYQKSWEAIFDSFKVIPGVHTCGNADWDRLFASRLEIISFNAAEYDVTRYPGYRSGKRIAWGVEKVEDVRDFRKGDLLTLPCGMGTKLYQIADCDRALARLREISGAVAPKRSERHEA